MKIYIYIRIPGWEPRIQVFWVFLCWSNNIDFYFVVILRQDDSQRQEIPNPRRLLFEAEWISCMNESMHEWCSMGILNHCSFIFILGVCSLDDRVYCIGGTYGPSGTKYCFRLNETESKWDRIANLQQGKKLHSPW